MMLYSGSVWPFYPRKTNGTTKESTGSQKLVQQEKSSSSLLCCSKIAFLEVFSCLTTVVHILVISLAFSILFHGGQEHLQFRGHTIESKVTGAELMIVGVTGAFVNGLALIGLWSRRRLFLVPVILFLIVNLFLDLITAIAFFCTHISDQVDHAQVADAIILNDVEMSKLATPVKHSKDRAFIVLFPFFLIKMVLSIIYLRCLLDVYKKDPVMTTNRRSPFKSSTNKKSCSEPDNELTAAKDLDLV